MANASFLLSTGRTSTQNIASIAARSHPDAIVEHESLGPDFFSRRVFRRPQKLPGALGRNIPLQRKLIEIEDAIAGGVSYLDAGWPSYAWLPYLADRFKGSFRFAHLVRNPFHVAASLTTHGLFSPEIRRGKPFERRAMIHIGDSNLHYSEIAERGQGFSPFERNLFHWLELNRFVLEQHNRQGFIGLFRFEDLYKSGEKDVTTLLDALLGPTVYDLNAPPVDNIRFTLPSPITPPNGQLVEAVTDLARQLGYSEHDLTAAADVDMLNKRYGEQRL